MLRVIRLGLVSPWLVVFAFGLAFGLASGCDTRERVVQPSIVITTVPEVSAGGSGKLGRIAGRVTGARPGQQVVLFAKSGVWWVQPFTVRPFTQIEADSTWKSTIHLGTEYAALLVDAAFRPPATTDVAYRKPGGPVIAVSTVKGTGDFIAARAARR